MHSDGCSDFPDGAPPDPSNSVYPQADDDDFPSYSSPPPESNPPPPPGVLLHADLAGNPDFALQPATMLEACFRHSGWAPRRLQVWNALQALHVSPRKLEAFACCGSALWLEADVGGEDLRLRSNGCRNRFCIPCQNERAAKILANLKDHVAGKELRFVTFTLRHSPTPLSDQIDRLLRSFVALRRRSIWSEHVAGGAAFLEAKVSSHDGLWHVHLHCLVEGDYFPHRDLSDAWLAVTGDSSIVDIQLPRDWEGTCSYVVKYVTKPADSTVFNHRDRLQEMVSAMAGRHLCMTFGTWRGFKLNASPKSPGNWKPIGNVETLFGQAKRGDPAAQRWVYAACRKFPALATILGVQIPGP